MRTRTRTTCWPSSCDLAGQPPPASSVPWLYGFRGCERWGGLLLILLGGSLCGGGERGRQGHVSLIPFPPPPRAVLLWRAARARGFAAGNEAGAGLIPGSRLGGGAAPGSPPTRQDRGTPPRRGGGAICTGHKSRCFWREPEVGQPCPPPVPGTRQGLQGRTPKPATPNPGGGGGEAGGGRRTRRCRAAVGT